MEIKRTRLKRMSEESTRHQAQHAKATQALAEGFCPPPDLRSMPLYEYMVRIMELRGFVSFFFGLIRPYEEYDHVPESVLRQSDDGRMVRFTYDYSIHRPFVNEMLVGRAVDSFNLYLTSMLEAIFKAKPETLKTESQIAASKILELGTYEEVVRYLIEKQINELSYGPLSDLQKYIHKRTGIELFPNKEDYESAALAREVRNLITHAACRPNDLFRRRTNGFSVPIPEIMDGTLKLTDSWVRTISYKLDSVVFKFDQQATAKYLLTTTTASPVKNYLSYEPIRPREPSSSRPSPPEQPGPPAEPIK